MTKPQDGTDPLLAAVPSSTLVAALVEPLLDARAHPAADQFDRLLADAASTGAISQELARELRFWQRAAVHELADHILTVLPAVLPVAVAAVTRSATEVAAAAAAATAAWQDRAGQPVADVDPPAAEPPAADPADVDAPAADLPAAEAPEVVPSASDEVAGPDDDAEAAPAVTNPQLRRRLFVAGLTSTA